MTTTELSSREYKLMLSTTRFYAREAASGEWMELVRRVIMDAGGTLIPQPELDADEMKKRHTWFLDTAANAFRQLDWILRVRKEKKKDKDDFNLTLKFRSPDRFISAAQDVRAGDGLQADEDFGKESKLEEDIVPAFDSRYSRSNKLKSLKDEPNPGTVGGAAKLFPVLETLKIPPETPIVVADGGFKVLEVVLQVGGFRFGGGPDIKMSQTFWYPDGTDDSRDHFPIVAEFSFDFEAAKHGEPFPLDTIVGADAVFRRLQAQAGWMDVSGTTKSALIGAGL